MKLVSLLAVVALATSGFLALAGSARPEDPITVDYSFRSPPLHAKGPTSMADLRGKPVVVDFWGRN